MSEKSREEIETTGISFEAYCLLKEEIGDDLMTRIHPILKEIQDSQYEMKKQLEPIAKIFGNVNGFDRVIKWILIRLGMIGAGLGGFYLLFEELKKFIKTH